MSEYVGTVRLWPALDASQALPLKGRDHTYRATLVPYIRGDKGDQGETGPQGQPGEGFDTDPGDLVLYFENGLI